MNQEELAEYTRNDIVYAKKRVSNDEPQHSITPQNFEAMLPFCEDGCKAEYRNALSPSSHVPRVAGIL